MKKYAYVNGIILNGHENMEPQKGFVITTENEKITAIKKVTEKELRNEKYTIIDLKGRYIMPGLINLHVHLPGSGKPIADETSMNKKLKLIKKAETSSILQAILRKTCESYAKTELLSGVTTIRTVAGLGNFDTQIRDRINAGKVKGPRILAANMGISVPNGHMAGSVTYIANSAEEAVLLVQKIAKDKPNLIKLMVTGGVLDAKVAGEPGVLRMKPEIIKAACDEAHKLGLPVAAHVEGVEGLQAALASGIDTIEHGAKPNDEIIRLFKENGSAQIVTLSPALPYAFFDTAISKVNEAGQINGRVVFDGIVSCAKTCMENAIPVGLGTDTACSYVTHYGMWRELNYFHKYCGVSRKYALYTATLKNAQIAKIDHLTGSIDSGKMADMIVIKENPLEKAEALRHIDMVIMRGKIINNPRIKEIPQIDQELDKYL